jgi:hypothetical protein
MEHLQLKVSKDIYNIIKKYIDYSLENMNKLLIKYDYKRNENRKQLVKNTLLDILVECIRLGFNGFYIDESDNLTPYLIELMNIEKLDIKHNKIDNYLYFEFKISDKYQNLETFCINIYNTGVITIIES